jgi:radical SAM superfamily enzyme YgiQ (UPF0313 family)
MPMRVGLIQTMNVYSGQCYVPYSVGLLQAYAQRYLPHVDRYEFQLPLYARLPVAEAVERLEHVDVALFSVYVWNHRYSLEVARALKSRNPEVIVAFGGPHVPDLAGRFLREHPFIDLACHKEGEGIIVPLLEACADRDWSGVPSVSWLDADGQPRTNAVAPRIRELDTIPSPYLEGVFEPLLAAHPDERWSMLLETNRGCPYGCTFCDWGSATQARLYPFGMERLAREIEWAGARRIPYIFCCDANFGILERDVEIARCAAEVRRRFGFPETLSIQTTKSNPENIYRVWKTLIDAGLNREAAMPLQSVDRTTLREVKRINVALTKFRELHHRFSREDIRTYSDILIGLPGETYDSFADGVSTVIDHGQHHRIQFGNLSILPNAELAGEAQRRRHGLETVRTRLVGTQQRLMDEEEVSEEQELVIATATLPREDWVRAKVFSWFCVLLHFYKVLQIPFVILHQVGGLSYRAMLEAFAGHASEDDEQDMPTLQALRRFFRKAAREIQQGGPEYASDERLPGLRVPPDDLMLVLLRVENRLEPLYREAEQLLETLLRDRAAVVPRGLVEASIRLNARLFVPSGERSEIELPFNVWEVFEGCLDGADAPLRSGRFLHEIDPMRPFYRAVRSAHLDRSTP